MLLKQWPAITVAYGIKPWEVDLFTKAELTEYFEQLSRFRSNTGEE